MSEDAKPIRCLSVMLPVPVKELASVCKAVERLYGDRWTITMQEETIGSGTKVLHLERVRKKEAS